MADVFTRDYDDRRHKGMRFGTLWFDRADSGDVTLCEDFHQWDNLLRLDILGDVINLLTREYNLTIKEFEDEMEEIRKKSKNSA